MGEVAWDFGDGTTSTQKDNVLKSYSKIGAFHVVLRANVEVENKEYAHNKNAGKLKEYCRELEIIVQ